MKTAYLKSPFQFEIREQSIREINADEVLIKIKACSICGSDLNSAAAGTPDWAPFGHEVSGIIEQTGQHVENVRAGDRVALESGTFCRYCRDCRNGRVDLCNHGPNRMFKTDPGGFGELMIAAKEQVVPINDLSFAEAALIEPLGVAMDLVYTADVKLNDDVLVIGLGPIGIMAIRLARLSGARKIYAADRSTSTKRHDLARAFGADEILYSDLTDLATCQYARGGVDKVLITAPPRVIPAALKTLNYGGTAAFLGFDTRLNAEITFNANDFHVKKLQLKASYAAPALYFPRCIELVASGLVDVQALITSRFKLADIQQAMLTLRDDKANQVKMVMIND